LTTNAVVVNATRAVGASAAGVEQAFSDAWRLPFNTLFEPWGMSSILDTCWYLCGERCAGVTRWSSARAPGSASPHVFPDRTQRHPRPV